MEKDDEVKGNGNSYTAEFWQYDSRLGRRWNTDPVTVSYESPYVCFGNNPIFNIDPYGDFKTEFGAKFYAFFKGGEVFKDKGGEWGVRNTEGGGIGPEGQREFEISISERFDWSGRNKGKDLKLEAAKEKWVEDFEYQMRLDSYEKLGIYDRNLSAGEARKNLINNGLSVVLPMFLKYGTVLTNVTRIKASSLQEFKQLVQQLSKPGSKLTQKEFSQLQKLAKEFGGKIRVDLKGVKGTGVDPHVHIEGLGKSIESRHIWLEKGVR